MNEKTPTTGPQEKDFADLANDIFSEIGYKGYLYVLGLVLEYRFKLNSRSLRRQIQGKFKVNAIITKEIQQLVADNNHETVKELIKDIQAKKDAELLDKTKNLKVLRLPITKEYFDQILAGKKLIDYREFKQYWSSRLVNKETGEFKQFDIIEIKNGYTKKSPVILAKYLSTRFDKTPKSLNKTVTTDYCYSIHIGDIMRTENLKQDVQN